MTVPAVSFHVVSVVQVQPTMADVTIKNPDLTHSTYRVSTEADLLGQLKLYKEVHYAIPALVGTNISI
jgi:hypothetical protein